MAKKKTTARYNFSGRETKVGIPAGRTTTPAKKRRIGLTSVQPSKAASSNLNATSIADGLRVILNAYDGKNKSMGGSDMFGADSNDRDKAKKAAWEDYESKWFNMGDQQGNKEWKRLKLKEWKLMRQQKKGGLDKNKSFIASSDDMSTSDFSGAEGDTRKRARPKGQKKGRSKRKKEKLKKQKDKKHKKKTSSKKVKKQPVKVPIKPDKAPKKVRKRNAYNDFLKQMMNSPKIKALETFRERVQAIGPIWKKENFAYTKKWNERQEAAKLL